MGTIGEPIIDGKPRTSRKHSEWKQLRSLVPYLGRYRGKLAVGLLLLVFVAIIGALPQLMVGAITDCIRGAARPLSTLSGASREWLGPIFSLYVPSSHSTLAAYCLILVGSVGFKDILTFLMRRLLVGVSREIEFDLRNDLTRKLLKLNPEFYASHRTGDLMSRSTNDLGAVRMLLGQGIMFIATTVTTTTITVYFMYKLSPILTLCVLAPMPVIAVADRYFGRTIHRLSDQIQEALGSLSAQVQENLTGIRVIRGYIQEKYEIEVFNEANRAYTDKNIQLIGIWSIFFPVLTVLSGVTFVILLGVGGQEAMSRRISVGTLWAFYAFLARLAWPMMALGWTTNIIQRGAASMGRLNHILSIEGGTETEAAPSDRASSLFPVERENDETGAPEEKQKKDESSLPIVGEIEFRHLTFGYPAGRSGTQNGMVLHDINLRIPAGSTLAVIGPTGCGKSTLAAMITRLWDVPRGTLYLDGIAIEDYPLDRLRRSIGYVPQDTFLFSDTIQENIAFGAPNSQFVDILGAAQIAGIADYLQALPEGFDTTIGERGVTLSGGQKQRVALARAIMRRPEILILDDALSSVDTNTEAMILRRLREIMKERTTILISHRISTVKSAHNIIVLRGGCIVEQGTHDRLLAMDGYYSDLHEKQMLEEELECQ